MKNIRRGLMVLSLLALGAQETPVRAAGQTLTPPATGKIPVAFLISDGAVMIDFSGPWAVFEAARGHFQLYTVAETAAPIHASSGMKIVPDYTLATAPRPRVIVIPAQENDSAAVLDWIRRMSATSDVTMSVCAGAFILAETGLLDGKSATVYHNAFNAFARQFPKVTLKRGVRFVENGNLATAGGLSSGIDLALRVVERYFGRQMATDVAYDMEYQGQGWTDPSSNAIYAKPPTGTIDPVCGMAVDPKRSPSSQYQGKTYYFCNPDEKVAFDAHPERYVKRN
jgi:putative intracellular protease/amidase/YHS domain-containing protein